MVASGAIEDLVERADDASLLRVIDELSSTGDWDELVRLKLLCDEASHRGKPTWPISEQISYRLALEAPVEYLKGIIVPGAGRFALGPLTEVAAQSHTWEELRSVITRPEVASVLWNERVLRGENLTGTSTDLGEFLELGPVLAPFETACVLPLYKAREAAFDSPPPPAGDGELVEGGEPGETADYSGDKIHALRSVCESWIAESNGVSSAVAVTGDARSAIAQLSDSFRAWEVPVRTVYAHIQWAGASGGAQGRRRGGAAGRFSAWYALALCSGSGWPVSADELDEALSSGNFFLWQPSGAAQTGWSLRVAMEFPHASTAFALDASDAMVGT